MRTLGVVTASILLYLSLFPFNFDFQHPGPGMTWTPMAMTRDWVDVIANFLAYIPLGFFGVAAIAAPGWRAIWTITGLGALLSLFVEWAQLYLPMRDSSLRDLACNTAGAFAGAWIAHLAGGFRARTWPLAPSRRSIFFLVCWLVWHTFPFMVALRRDKFWALPDQMARWIWNPLEFIDLTLAAAALLAVFLEDAPAPRGLLRWLLPATALVPVLLQFLTTDQPFSTARVAAVILGFTVAAAAWKPRSRPHWMALAALLAVWILVRQLQPFVFGPAASKFGWWPMEAVYSLNLDFIIRLLAAKFFFYTSLLAALFLSGFRPLPSAVLLTVAVAITEFLQIYIPARTPEITDVLMIPLAALVVRGIERKRAEGRTILKRPPQKDLAGARHR